MTVAVGSAVLLSSTDKPAFTASDKAFYADANLVNFVRPGLVITPVSAAIASDGTISVRFKLTDPKGLPLDLNGVTTPGAISIRMVAATIPNNQTQYVAYTTRPQPSPITKQTATQASFDTGGTYQQVGDGEYVYTFRTKAPANFDATATHTIGMWGARDLSEFDLESLSNNYSTVYNFVPNGSQVTKTRDVVRTESCNNCHDPLQAHDERRTVELCVLCHQPQSVDPDTGNTVDFPVMIHKIHMGANLPSVKAGRPYQIIGFQQSVHDYSTVVFPAMPSPPGMEGDPANCQMCHEQGKGAKQEMAFATNPSIKACGACHDNVNFASGEGHAGGLPVADGTCSQCHLPSSVNAAGTGTAEFDASILGAHTNPNRSQQLPGDNYEIVSVTNNQAGQKPTLTFRAKYNSGALIPLSELASPKGRASAVMGGPTKDYAQYFREDISKATASGDAYVYQFTNAIPANATGTWTIGLEGYHNVTLNPGTTKQVAVRDAAVNKTIDFSVDGSTVAARRKVVDLQKCNSCHFQLSVHGGNRNQIEQCVICHNPNETDRANRPADQAPARTVQFANMIHRIHTGEENQTEYTIFGNAGSRNDFTEVRFPGDRRNCNECHVNNSQNLPLPAGLLPVNDPRGFISPMGPATAACTGCHTSQQTASHALSNTTDKLGEACNTCHSNSAEFSVGRVHAR